METCTDPQMTPVFRSASHLPRELARLWVRTSNQTSASRLPIFELNSQRSYSFILSSFFFHTTRRVCFHHLRHLPYSQPHHYQLYAHQLRLHSTTATLKPILRSITSSHTTLRPYTMTDTEIQQGDKGMRPLVTSVQSQPKRLAPRLASLCPAHHAH